MCTQTLTRPPDGNNHPLWQAATDWKKDVRDKKEKKFTFSRTTSTAFQVAVDHAFLTPSRDRKPRASALGTPPPPRESRKCPCGVPIRSPQPHVLPLYVGASGTGSGHKLLLYSTVTNASVFMLDIQAPLCPWGYSKTKLHAISAHPVRAHVVAGTE